MHLKMSFAKVAAILPALNVFIKVRLHTARGVVVH